MIDRAVTDLGQHFLQEKFINCHSYISDWAQCYEGRARGERCLAGLVLLSLSTIRFAWELAGQTRPGQARREMRDGEKSGGRWLDWGWGQLSGPDHCNGSQSGLGSFCLWWREVRLRWGEVRRHHNNITHMVPTATANTGRGEEPARGLVVVIERKRYIL